MPVGARSRRRSADLFALFGRVAGRLVHAHGPVPSGARRPWPPLPLEAFENYVKGLVAATPAAQQRFLESAVRQAATDARILLALWDVHTAQGNHERALASASAVPADAPAYRQARLAVALFAHRAAPVRRRLPDADASCRAASGRPPCPTRSASCSCGAARAGGARGGRPTSSARSTTIRRTRTTCSIWATRTRWRGNTAEALTWLRETVRFDAADADAHLVMSAALVAAGRTTEAQREFELARLLGAGDGGVAGRAVRPRAGGSRTVAVGRRTCRPPRACARRAEPRAARPGGDGRVSSGQWPRVRRGVQATARRQASCGARSTSRRTSDEPHLLLGQVHQRAGRLAEAIDEFTVAIWCRDTVGRPRGARRRAPAAGRPRRGPPARRTRARAGARIGRGAGARTASRPLSLVLPSRTLTWRIRAFAKSS